MDPIAHTFTGAALAASGLRRATPLATAALIIGANVPDVDVVTSFAGTYASLALRRGWTHGLLAVAVFPFLITGLLLLIDRRMRRGQPGRPAARAGPLLGVAALAVATHPTLDWLNNYGLRWLMPFDDRWFYGDALFIIDPWVWLVLGAVLFLAYSGRRAALAGWGVFWLCATLLVLAVPAVPATARVLWVAGVAAMLAARRFWSAAPGHGPAMERTARIAVGCIAAYMAVAALANTAARSEVRAVLEAAGIEAVQDVMVAPAIANPFAGSVVAETPVAYYRGDWNWLATPHFRPAADKIVKLPRDKVIEAAIDTPDARRFLTWSRFPYFEVEPDDSGYVVRILDVRYEGVGRLGGLTVRVQTEGQSAGL